jgi:uncharacterized protein (TIGR03067 family)
MFTSSIILAFGLFAGIAEAGEPSPSESELRRAHALLSGVWEYVSLTDNGESLGLPLVRERLAQNGRLTIGDRVFRFVNPLSGKPRVNAYRINPSASPRQIDFTTEDDTIQRGIFQFENDELIICYNKRASGDRPTEFSAQEGSDHVLFRLRVAQSSSPDRPDVESTPLIRPSLTIATSGEHVTEQAESPEASASELRQAHDLLTGVWEITSLEESGESLGPRLIRHSLASNGRITVNQRALELIDPESGETRVLSYRINPATTPRQLDVVNESGGVVRGVYKIEGSELLVCMNHEVGADRPAAFESPRGSSLMLLRLKMLDAEPTPAPKLDHNPERIETPSPETEPAPGQPADNSVKFASRTTPATLSAPRRATESELRREHQLLTGTWKFVSVERNGETFGANLIRAKIAEDGLMTIGDRALRVVAPGSREKRLTAFRVNPTTTPAQIDVINQLDTELKGIYRFEGDELVLCLHNSEDGARPSDFSAPAGSNNTLMRLQMSEPAPSAQQIHPDPPAPTPEEL